ncbi:protein FAR1-RELATED SEQUENCE 6-like [Olea europaea var. sylvestris]|uniref:protein FAR1-RELATED SEQUENCE 6-like n=1 Tax=Olea europaea var. sylvestris TaxID=158386 RepID=UPI000C1D6051|nr:protein FAR1-RELATED SEQUENCE 6-like [Olea europaea var. sylvestris]
MPFALFVEVHHHGQSILLGCGLLSNEDTDTFVWLFRTWLLWMHGQVHNRTITDQDRATYNAIQIFVEEFERGWELMIDTYNLYDNEWLSSLYENRGRWVPYYLKTSFRVGMPTTQHSESVNAFFDMVLGAMLYVMEKQVQAVYTVMSYLGLTGVRGGRTRSRRTSFMKRRRGRKKFTVWFRAEMCDIVCGSHFFEFRGILCRHAISVLMINDVTSLSDPYILRRWRQDICRAHTRVSMNYADLISTPDQLRYEKL